MMSNEPHKCPICNGNGLVPNGFYTQTSGTWSSSSTLPETCRTCNGTGIVWSEQDKRTNSTEQERYEARARAWETLYKKYFPMHIK